MKIISEIKLKPSYFAGCEYNDNFKKVEEKSLILSESEMEAICDQIKRRMDFYFIQYVGEEEAKKLGGILDDIFTMLDQELLKIFD